MTTSPGGPVYLESNGAQTLRPSHRRSHGRAKKIAARVLLVLGLVIGILAVADFAYNAHSKADCYTRGAVDDWGIAAPGVAKSDDCRAEIVSLDEFQRLDAAAVVISVALLAWSAVMSRRIRKHRR